MRHTLLTLTALTLTTCTTAPRSPTAAPTPPSTTISGQILTPDHLPAPNATVHLVRHPDDALPPLILTTTSDPTGHFHFDHIRPIPPNAGSSCFIDAFTPTSGLTRTLLTPDTATTPITLTLTPASTLDGTITDPAGHPLPNTTLSLVAIHVRGLHPEGGIPWLNAWINFTPLPYTTTTSTPDGSFHFTHIPANSLLMLRATNPDYTTLRATAQSPGKSLTLKFQSPAARITGRILDAAGRPAPGIRVRSNYALYAPAETMDAQDVETTDADGRYTLTSLASGKYNVTADLNPSTQTALPLPTLQTESGKTITAPDIHIIRGTLVTGRIIDAATGKPVTAPQSSVSIETQPPSNFSTYTTAAPNGQFSLRLPPGSYHLQLQTSPPWYNDLASAWIDITENTPPKPLLLKATLDPNRPLPTPHDFSRDSFPPIVPQN